MSCHRQVSCLHGLPWWLEASRQAWDVEDALPEAGKRRGSQALLGRPGLPAQSSYSNMGLIFCIRHPHSSVNPSRLT